MEVTYLPVNKDGVPQMTDIQNAIRPDTALFAFTHVNNETGAIFPVRELCMLRDTHIRSAKIHMDCVQSLGKLPIALSSSGIDFASFSGHKIHSVKGSGLLYVRKGNRLSPLLYGGGQQRGLRSGTESPYLAAAMAEALRVIEAGREASFVKITACNAKLRRVLPDLGVQVLSPELASPYILNVAFPDFESETMLHALEEQEIYVSTVSACSSKQKKISYVLTEMGYNRAVASHAIRISFSPFSEMDEVDRFLSAVQDIYRKYSLKRGT